MTRALVTGAGGFVGRHLVARLLADGWDVTALVRPDGTASLPDAARTVAVDLTDTGAFTDVVAGTAPDVAFHLAAARRKATVAERATTTAVNTTASLHLVDALADSCRAVIRLGSSTEYAESPEPMDEETALRPRGFFGATKAAGSLLLTAAAAERGIRSAVLRAFQVYGPGDHPTRFVPTVLSAAADGGPLPLTRGGMRRDWVYVTDVVDACVRAAEAGSLPSGAVLNIGTGVQTANEELVAVAERVTGRRVDVRVGEHPGRGWDAASWVSDPSRAERLLGWRATTTLEQGLAQCWAATAAGAATSQNPHGAGRVDFTTTDPPGAA